MDELHARVVWMDGIGDTDRDCIICWSRTCVNPVHKEQYKVISNSEAKKWDVENPVI